jgi:hypothetical protein
MGAGIERDMRNRQDVQRNLVPRPELPEGRPAYGSVNPENGEFEPIEVAAMN